MLQGGAYDGMTRIPVAELHCLYCERPLALLHRLTGDKEFCSKDHRRQYMKEHGELALTRLLESRPKVAAKAEPTKRSGSILGLSLRDETPAEPPTVTTLPSSPPAKPPALPKGVRVLTTPPPVMNRSKSTPEVAPSTADFARGVIPPPHVAPGSIRQDFGPRGEPKWPKLPQSTAADDGQRTVTPPLFVTSGAFLRRKLQPALPSNYWTSRSNAIDAIELPPASPVWMVIEDRLRRTDRIGFCPP
jgi:hypothetical protein